MPEQITQFKCPSCTGPLNFLAASGLMECEYCGAKFKPEEIEALYQEKTDKAEANFTQEAEVAEAEGQWDVSEMSDDWGKDGAGMRAYNCTSCGAELVCDGTTAATICPYCGNNAIVPGQFSGVLKPDVVLPFKLDKAQAIAALKKHYSGKWLLPKAFSQANHIEEIQGVYVPFWLYHAQVDADCSYHGTNSRTYTSGSYEVTETDHFRVQRQGVVTFDGVPVDGSKKMENSYMDSLEPFDYSQLQPFSTAYLSGYVADRYDEDADQCAERADTRCKNSAIAAMRADITGYQSLTMSGSQTKLHRGKVRYALLPVWVLHTKWQEKSYLFMMNGQTGKFVGDLPVDKRKFWLSTAIGAVLLTLVLFFTKLGPFLGGIVAKWIFGIG